MRTDSPEPLLLLGTDFNTNLTLHDQVNTLDETISQCESDVSDCYEGMPENSITLLWEQVEDIEASIKSLAEDEPGYIRLPFYTQHLEAIRRFKAILLNPPFKPGKSKEIETKDLDETNPVNRVEQLLRTRLLAAGFHPQKSSDPFAFIAGLQSSVRVSGFLEKFYSALQPKEKQIFVERIVPPCVIRRSTVSENLDFLRPLITVDLKEGDNWTIASLAKGLDEIPQVLAGKYQAIHEEKSIYKQDLLMEFIGYGNVTKLGGLLTCAQLANRKSYPINATVLDEHELEDYFRAIQQCPTKRMEEYFVIVGAHWLSGAIEKQMNAQVRLLVIDVLGSADSRQYSKNVVNAFFKVFPNGLVFRNNEKLQHLPLGCSLFALEHLRHYPKTGSYLGMSLMQYFAEQETEKKSQKGGNNQDKIKFCHLPLPLLRVMEDSALHQTIIPSRKKQERERWIIKKEKTAAQCVEKDFHQVEEKSRNKRIGFVRDKFFAHNRKFLKLHTEAKIKEQMREFTLDQFRQRIASSNLSEPITSIPSSDRTPSSQAHNFYRLMPEPGPVHQRMNDYSTRESGSQSGWSSESAGTQILCDRDECCTIP